MPNSLKLRLPEVVVPGRRLGRTIDHDPRSLRYVVAEAAAPVIKEWDEKIPILDQGDLGSCTGNACVGMLGTEPFFDTVPAGVKLDEAFAVKLYSLATQLDDYPGQYPPDDSGSSGLGVSKAAQQDGLASGYTHATSLAGCYTMIGSGPFVIGINWYEGMDDPDANGNVQVSGQIRGGHEVCVVARQSDGRWRIRNSWGAGWGHQGRFYLTDDQLTRLLAEQGDATQLTPINVPAPTPTPTPVPPIPTPTPTPPGPPGPNAFPAPEFEAAETAFRAWLKHHRSEPKTRQLIADGSAFFAAMDAWPMRG